MATITLLRPLLPSVERNKKHQDYSMYQRILNGERSAHTEFYNQYAGKMFTLALRYVSSRMDAQEIVNTSFVKAIKSIKYYNNSGSLEGWLRTIVKRTAIDHCRKYIYKKPSKVELMEYDAKVYNKGIDQLDAEDFLQLIQLVPNASRVVFNLFAIEGYSHKEISKELDISIGTSKWHVSNARKILSNAIKSQGYGQ